jgi:hypothetical protein
VAWRTQHGSLNHNTTEDSLEIQLNLRGFIFNEFNDHGNIGRISTANFYICCLFNLVPRAFPFLSLGRRENALGSAGHVISKYPHFGGYFGSA